MFLSCIKFFRREAQVDVGPFDASALNASYDDAVTDVNASPEIDAGAEADIENQLVSQSEKKKKKKKRSKKGKEDDRERATSDSEEEVLADKAGKLTRTKSGRSSKKSKRKSIATSDSENDMNNTSEDKIVSDDLIESGNDDEGQSSRRKSRKSSRKSGKSSKSIKGKRMSASERSRKRAQDYEDDEEEAPEVEEVKEVVVKIEMLEWTCIVCGTFSNLPRHPTIDTDVVFGEKGVHYKRTYAHILFGRDMPKCAKCYTYADYKPPLGSAHLFRHNPELYKGYSDYPHKPTVQTGFPSDKSIRSRLVRGKGYCQSFFCGMHDNYNSYAIQNDWRLKKYVFDGFPEIPRVVLTPGDFYCVGEIIECKLQKTDWARAKITEVHSNHTYNIRYDPGDELRYVLESSLRSRPEKRAYVYRVEQCMLLIVVLLPIGLLGMVTGQPSLLALGLMISMTILFSIRCVTMIQYFYNYYAAGLLKILAIHTFYTLPIFFLWIGSIIGMANGSELSTWTTVVVLIIMGKIFSLPILYMMRPAFALISMVLFLFSSAGLFLTAEYVAGSSPFPYIAIPIGPLIILLLLIKYLRKHLHNVWDVCLVIRPKIDISYTNPSIFLTIRNWLC